MDTGKGSGKRESQEEIDLTNKEEIEKLRKEFVGEPSELSFDEARKHNEQVAQSIFQSLDKRINSHWTSRKDKDYLKLFRYTIAEHKKMTDVVMNLAEWAFDFKQALFGVFLEIELTKGLAQKDIGTIKSRMDALLESPAVKQLEKIINDNEEAFKKLDRTRQEILRDSIV